MKAEDIAKIRFYVENHSKVWYMGNKRQWNCAVNMGIDINELGITKEQAKENMIKRISQSTFLYSFIKDKKLQIA